MRRMGYAIMRGYARSADLFGSLKQYTNIYSGEQKDYQAIKSDWANVGNSLKGAVRKYAETKA